MNSLQENQRRWLADELEKAGRGARTQLAKHLGLRNDAITRMTNLDAGESREISVDELVRMAQFFKSKPPGLEGIPDRIQPQTIPTKLIRTSRQKFYIREWREFMGVKIDAGARAAGMDEDEYQAYEAYPINFTLAQIVALADEFGCRGDQFWFPAPRQPRNETSGKRKNVISQRAGK